MRHITHLIRRCRTSLIIALLVSLVPVVWGADDDNPYRKTKVGDWVEYQMTGPNMEGKTKMTVVAKDDKELTYEVFGSFTYNGMTMIAPVQMQKIDLTKSYDPVVHENLKAKGGKVAKEAEGKEKLKVGNKEYDTTWVKSKMTNTTGGVTVVTETKMWFAKDVPLSGMVRMESTVGNFATKLDLIASGGK